MSHAVFHTAMAQQRAPRYGDGEAVLLTLTHQQHQHPLGLGLRILLGHIVPCNVDMGNGVAALGAVKRGGVVELQIGPIIPCAAICAACQGKQQQGKEQREQAFHAVSPPCARGRRTVNTVPTPDWRCPTSMVPPRRSTVSRTMDRPRPVPPTARERFLSTR